MNTLWFYDYFLTLADEVGLPFTPAVGSILCQRIGQVGVDRQKAIRFVIDPNPETSLTSASGFALFILVF